MMSRFPKHCTALMAALLPFVMASQVQAQTAVQAQTGVRAPTFEVDFGKWRGQPLVKTKFGVYQTPLISEEKLLQSTALLREAGVRDFRYEIGLGKPDVLAFDQVRGTPDQLVFDFQPLERLVERLNQSHVRLMLGMTYNPLPLKNNASWPAWKDVPNNLAAWQLINRRYAGHFAEKAAMRPFYEIWNEPDLPGDGGKVFFNGDATQFGPLYSAAAAGVRAGDAQSAVGGPGIAYDLRYVAPMLSQPLDFVSIHAYENYAPQINGLRRILAARPELPILLTEYASYQEFGLRAPISRHAGAMRFFRDVKGLLEFPDTSKVYWAQWVDDDLGLITKSLQRKAIFNAYKIYQTLLPVDRNAVTPDAADGLSALAASDEHSAGVALWNETTTDKNVTIKLNRLPFARGHVELYRIDANNASVIDNPESENLRVEKQWPVSRSEALWSGVVAAESVVFLRARDGRRPSSRRSWPLGTFVRDYGWFPDRASTAYADFDAQSGIARVGMGEGDFGVAQIGHVLNNAASKMRVQVQKSGPFAPQDINALFALRFDYGVGEIYAKSVLIHNGSFRGARNSALPWGRGGAVADVQIERRQMNTSAAFSLDIARLAPPGWNRRLIVTPILQNMGAHSQARIVLSALSK